VARLRAALRRGSRGSLGLAEPKLASEASKLVAQTGIDPLPMATFHE
jgi:hypothetical protein